MPPRTVLEIARGPSDLELISLFVQVSPLRKVGGGCHGTRITDISNLRSVTASEGLSELVIVFVFF